MDKIFGPAYSGDPGIPHSGKEMFHTTIWAPVIFSIASIFNPYYWQSATEVNWHDWAMVHENTQRKRALKKKQPYEPKFNKLLNKPQRESFYHSWPVFFPWVLVAWRSLVKHKGKSLALKYLLFGFPMSVNKTSSSGFLKLLLSSHISRVWVKVTIYFSKFFNNKVQEMVTYGISFISDSDFIV